MATAVISGCIEPQVLYTAEEAQTRLKMKGWAWRGFRASSGLRLTKIGRINYVRGRDIIDAVDRIASGGVQ